MATKVNGTTHKVQEPKPQGTVSIRVLDAHDEEAISSKTRLPIEYQSTALTSTKGKEYYPAFAPTDDLFRFLLSVRLLSPTQAGCISDKVFYTLGTGLQINDEEFPSEFDKKINADSETIDDIIKIAADSIYQDGNAFIEISQVEVGSTVYVHCYIHPNMDCRLLVPDKGSRPTHVIRSKDFRKDGNYSTFKKDEEDNDIIPLWTDDPTTQREIWTTIDGVKRTMIHLKNRVNGVDHYGLPTNYAGTLNAILEYKNSRFNCDNFDNNLFIPGILFIQGNLSEAEERKLLKKIRAEHRGEGKQQRVMVVSSEGGLTDTKFVPLQEKQEGHFIEFDKHQEEKIIGANDWSRALRDMKQSGGLGKGGDYVKNLFKMKYHSVIKPVQQIIINNFIFPLMKIIDEANKGKTKWYSKPWVLIPIIPASLDGLLDLNALLTVDEGRKELGREPHKDKKKGEMLIVEVKEKAKGDNAPKPVAPAGGATE